jgi:hypothetical protein
MHGTMNIKKIIIVLAVLINLYIKDMSMFLTKYYSNVQIKKNQTVGSYGTYELE